MGFKQYPNHADYIRVASGTASVKNKTKAKGIVIDSADSYKLKYNQNGTIRSVVDEDSIKTLGSLTVASQEIVTATNVITAAESGKTFFLNSATEFVSTLPAVAVGLKYKFVVTAAPSGASYTIVADSGTPILGFVLSKDLNSATDGGSTAGTGVLTITLVDGKAQKGDTVTVECDGTNWYALCFTGGNFDSITLS